MHHHSSRAHCRKWFDSAPWQWIQPPSKHPKPRVYKVRWDQWCTAPTPDPQTQNSGTTALSPWCLVQENKYNDKTQSRHWCSKRLPGRVPTRRSAAPRRVEKCLTPTTTTTTRFRKNHLLFFLFTKSAAPEKCRPGALPPSPWRDPTTRS